VQQPTTLEILSPGAGQGVVKEVANELLSRPQLVRKMADSLERGLTATRRTWDSGQKCWVEEPDMRSQLQAVFGCFSHFCGDPTKRIVHEHINANGALDVSGALQDSPALAAALERELEKARWRHSGQQKHKRPGGKAKTVASVPVLEVE
jgi:hypothetical protein